MNMYILRKKFNFLLIRIKTLNSLCNFLFVFRYFILIIIPLFLLIFYKPLIGLMDSSNSLLIDAVILNSDSIKTTIGILIGAYIPFVGTWSYESYNNKKKNACFKKEIIYIPLLQDIDSLNSSKYIPSFYIYNNSYTTHFNNWNRLKQTSTIFSLNNLLQKEFNNVYNLFEKIKEQSKTFESNIAISICKFLAIPSDNLYMCDRLYNLMQENDKESILDEIDMFLNRPKYPDKSKLTDIYENIVLTSVHSFSYQNLDSNIQLFELKKIHLKQTLVFLISYINNHYESGNKLT